MMDDMIDDQPFCSIGPAFLAKRAREQNRSRTPTGASADAKRFMNSGAAVAAKVLLQHSPDLLPSARGG